MRYFARAATVALVAWCSLVLGTGVANADVPIVPAQTFEQIIQDVGKLRVPGSVQSGALGGVGGSAPLTTVQRVAGTQRAAKLSSTLNKVALTQATFSESMAGASGVKKAGVKAAGAAGTALTAAFVIDLTYTAFTGGFGEGFGFQGLTGATSDGLMCDLKAIVGSPDCVLAASPAYDPNSDALTGEPGWLDAVNTVQYEWWGYPASGGGYQKMGAGTARLEATGPPVGQGGQALLAAVVGPSPVPGRAVDVRLRYEIRSALPGGWGGGGTVIKPGTSGSVVVSSEQLTAVQTAGGYSFGAGPIGSNDFTARWFPEGHPLRPADPDPDPARQWETTWQCSDGSSSRALSDPWHESDPEWPMPLEPSCSSGGLTYIKVAQTVAGGDPWVLYEWSIPSEVSTWAGTYPECTTGSCVLELHRVESSSGTRLSCFETPDACASWFEDPAKIDNYVCTYGGRDLDLAECNAYAAMFDRARATTSGPTFADPLTGEVPALTGDPVDRDPTCPPKFEMSLGGMGYWVWKGVSCAIDDAFVPRPATLAASTAAITTAVEAGPVGSIQGSIDGLSSLDMSGGCGVLVETSPSVFRGQSLKIDTCNTWWSSWGAIRNIIGVGFLVGSVWAGANVILRSVGIYAGDRKDDDK